MFTEDNVKVLIVEDDFLADEKIRELVETLGYSVVGSALDGHEAVQMTEALRPDVVLMDIKMPGMDGIEAAHLIQERCPTPVVILTALQTPALINRASAAGVGAYLTKPPTALGLARSIIIAIARFKDMQELRRLNETLQAEIAERKQAEEELQRLLAEKQTLLKEVHHRTKNNLAVISSLLDLQATLVQDASARSALLESKNRIQSMAFIHERLYKSQELDRIELGQYIESLGQKVSSAYGGLGITLSVESEDIFLGVGEAISCGLIANELISNAFKHAFPDRKPGNILVRLETLAGPRVRLTVSDDGVGLPADFDFDSSTTLGLQLVNLLAQQLDGTVEPVRAGDIAPDGAGTTFVLTFPVP